MSRKIMLIPEVTNVGLTSVSLGIIYAMKKKNIFPIFFKPISQPCFNEDILDTTTRIIRANSIISFIEPLQTEYVESLISSDQKDVVMEKIITRLYEKTKNSKIVLIEGLIFIHKHPFIHTINYEIARTLNAEIVFVLESDNFSKNNLKARIALMCAFFGGKKNKNITGVIINKLNSPMEQSDLTQVNLLEIFNDSSKKNKSIDYTILNKDSPIPILGCIPWNLDLIAIRVVDIVNNIDSKIINEGDMRIRRVTSIILCTRELSQLLDKFCFGSLLIVSMDRIDVLISACLAAINGIKISAILLTDSHEIDEQFYKLFEHAFKTGLPIFSVQTSIFETLYILKKIILKIPENDFNRIQKLQNYMASYIQNSWIESFGTQSKLSHQLSPPAFRYHLSRLAQQANKRIALPEGDEPRTIKAASICANRGIAHCILLGNPENIQKIAEEQHIHLNKCIEIYDPKIEIEKYVHRLVDLRKNKGMTEEIARKQLEDNIVLGTLMLEGDEVDGLVSGAIHTTANTIRAPLQLIKTSPGNSLVSSIFFMLLPDQVLIYGDCAINSNPNSEQLAEIAIQSANSAIAFGIEPRVAMISYSTGNSGTGNDVEKVREATRIAKTKRPDLLIDGPLQYDAAIMADVAMYKAPNSPVAGRATVFIFPDLNTGNTTYKAVQRSANLISIGPMLQGIRKPVNDLSRGALVDDIVYTVALTAIQAKQNEK